MIDNLENAEIAVQKGGRLTQGSIEWLNQKTGSDFPVNDDPFDRTRELTDSTTGITLTGYSNGDIFKAVACGMADYGIVGEDKLEELLYPQANRWRLVGGGFNRFANLTTLGVVQSATCKLVLARRKGADYAIERVATSYPNLMRDWLSSTRDRCQRASPVVDTFSGSVEPIARKNGYDTILEITHSGETLAANDFEIEEEIRTYSTVLIERRRDPISIELFDVMKNPSILDIIFRRLEERRRNPISSEASRLVMSSNEAIKKFGQEGAELIAEIPVNGKIELEAADVLFSLVALMVQSGQDIGRIQTELAGRYQGQALQAPLERPRFVASARPLVW